MGTKLLEAVTENHRLEKVGIKVLNSETKENIEMYSYMNKLGLADALTGGENDIPVVERSYKFIRKLIDNSDDSIIEFSRDDDSSSGDESSEESQPETRPPTIAYYDDASSGDESSEESQPETRSVVTVFDGKMALDSTFAFLKMNSGFFRHINRPPT